jgi:hypothetical protein
LVFVTGSFAGTADALWLKMEGHTEIVAIDRERNERVQGAAEVHNLTRTVCSAGNKNGQIDVRFIVHLDRRISRQNRTGKHGKQTHYYRAGSFHDFSSN